MGLEPLGEAPHGMVLQHRPCDEHADRLATDRPGADLAVGDREQVRQVEMAMTHLDHPTLPADQHRHQQILGGVLFVGHPEQRITRTVEHHVPGIRLLRAAVERGEEPCGRPGGRDGDRFIADDPMREEHRRGIALPHLQRMDIGLVVDQIEIEQDLGGVPDRGDRRKAVEIAGDREIGDGVEVEQPRTDDAEEVHHHQVRMPVAQQLGQAVEDIEDPLPLPGDKVVEGGREVFEPLGRVEFDDRDPARVQHHRRMVGESDIDDPPTVGQRPGDIGIHDPAIVLDRVDLPHHVVPEPEPVDDTVQPAKAGGDGVVGVHGPALALSRRAPSALNG